ncbi:unnamed protein product, partial [Mesorhabditis belari]|uniref:Uncharacterized protein n=1 Tax=Mesorhabditis belari TaxID=2138241 RepID=A0AAF3FIB5_9BILA
MKHLTLLLTLISVSFAIQCYVDETLSEGHGPLVTKTNCSTGCDFCGKAVSKSSSLYSPSTWGCGCGEANLAAFDAEACTSVGKCYVDEDFSQEHTSRQKIVNCSDDCEYCGKITDSRTSEGESTRYTVFHSTWGCGCGDEFLVTFTKAQCFRQGQLKTSDGKLYCCWGDLCNSYKQIIFPIIFAISMPIFVAFLRV